jgi:hypothetical protein
MKTHYYITKKYQRQMTRIVEKQMELSFYKYCSWVRFELEIVFRQFLSNYVSEQFYNRLYILKKYFLQQK